MIEVRDVTKSFGPNRVLDRVAVTVPAGRTTVLLGPSGGGKSTLLRVMNGLVRPDAGEVRFDGRTDSKTLSTAAPHGVCGQDGDCFRTTAAGNITLWRGIWAWIAAEFAGLVAL